MATPQRPAVPAATVQRLPVYLRCLHDVQRRGERVINSEQLASVSGTNAAQVRKDLSYLGDLGTRGLGYDVGSLAAQLARFLGVDRTRRVAIAGYGRLGSALHSYPGFASRGFAVVAVLDSDRAKIGADAGELAVEDVSHLGSVVEERGVDLVIIATPADAAQSVADAAVEAGVRAILNLAPAVIDVPAGVLVRYADLASELQVLSFHLSHGKAS